MLLNTMLSLHYCTFDHESNPVILWGNDKYCIAISTPATLNSQTVWMRIRTAPPTWRFLFVVMNNVKQAMVVRYIKHSFSRSTRFSFFDMRHSRKPANKQTSTCAKKKKPGKNCAFWSTTSVRCVVGFFPSPPHNIALLPQISRQSLTQAWKPYATLILNWRLIWQHVFGTFAYILFIER